MTDKSDKPSIIPVTDPHRVQTVFVNEVIGSGHLNGVVNLTFATYLFTPASDGKIDPDRVISSRLRLDGYCLHQLYAVLGGIIAEQNGDKPKPN